MVSYRTPVDVDWARKALTAVLHDDGSDCDLPFQANARIGDYELLEELGRGASGVVYRARQISRQREVALKVMRNAHRATDSDVQRFRFGAEAAAELDHPNIGRIRHVGEWHGVPYFAMPLFKGGTLAEASPLRQNRVRAVEVMAKVARAVHHAHQRGVLHRDLKPANIVLDEQGEPYVVDFGLAKLLDERALTSKPSILAGTIGYMAPEQAASEARSLTFACDIYALGAILYELLTREVPFEGRDLIRKLFSAERVRSPRELDRTIDEELEYICFKCLEKDPSQRYASAAELAQDLEDWLNWKPILRASERPLRRLLRWCGAHPVLFTSLAGAVCVLAATAAVALSVAREQVPLLLSDVLADAAHSKAGQALLQLQRLSDALARCASDPRIQTLVAGGDSAARPAPSDRLLIECGATTLFDSVTVADSAGSERARLPRREPGQTPGESMRRDDFLGARQRGEAGYRSLYVGRVLGGASERERYLALSAPVFDGDNSQWLGVVHVTVALSAFIESLQLSDSARRMVVLVGVRDAAPGDPPGAARQGVSVLLHGPRAEMHELASGPWSKALSERAAHDQDPLRFPEPSRAPQDNPQSHALRALGNGWLAGFAPVGYTGYAVIAATRDDVALEGPLRVVLELAGRCGAIFVLGAGAVLAVALLLERRGRRRFA